VALDSSFLVPICDVFPGARFVVSLGRPSFFFAGVTGVVSFFTLPSRVSTPLS